MKIIKRIILFLTINFIILMTLSLIMSLFNIRPYISAYGIDYKSLLLFSFIWGMGGAFISLLLSRKIAKMFMRIQIIKEDNREYQKLYRMIEKLSRDAMLTNMPEVGVFSSQSPNAFATGPTKNRSLVAVSTGLLQVMTDEEVEAVLAHEISHIVNGDMVTMTLLQGVINAFVIFLARAFAYAITMASRGNNNRRGGSSYLSFYLLTFLFEMVFMVFGTLIIAAFSRWREFRADKGSADLTSPEKMIKALKKLQLQTRQEKLPASCKALMINLQERSFLSLFATHPPLNARIKRLEERTSVSYHMSNSY